MPLYHGRMNEFEKSAIGFDGRKHRKRFEEIFSCIKKQMEKKQSSSIPVIILQTH